MSIMLLSVIVWIYHFFFLFFIFAFITRKQNQLLVSLPPIPITNHFLVYTARSRRISPKNLHSLLLRPTSFPISLFSCFTCLRDYLVIISFLFQTISIHSFFHFSVREYHLVTIYDTAELPDVQVTSNFSSTVGRGWGVRNWKLTIILSRVQQRKLLKMFVNKTFNFVYFFLFWCLSFLHLLLTDRRKRVWPTYVRFFQRISKKKTIFSIGQSAARGLISKLLYCINRIAYTNNRWRWRS